MPASLVMGTMIRLILVCKDILPDINGVARLLAHLPRDGLGRGLILLDLPAGKIVIRAAEVVKRIFES